MATAQHIVIKVIK